jgi:hypothetical protein
VASEGSQVACGINEKLRIRNIVFLGESMKERHCGVAPAAAVHIHFQQEL